ncbi:MAG: pitrilysin family protein, partial [Thermodesulfobacteriota bacterium]
MTLVVAGDVKTRDALARVMKSFSGFRKGGNPLMPRPSEHPQRALKVKIITQPVMEARMSMGFHIPELKHPDNFTLDVLALILGQGASSRLHKKIKQEEQLVHSISVSAMTPRDPGLFFISSVLNAENIDKTLSEIIRELTKLAAVGPTSKELDKAKLSLESDFIYERETMQGKARHLGYFETLTGNIEFDKEYIAGVNKVTADNIKNAVKKYLTKKNMTVAVLLPEEKEKLVNKQELKKHISRSFKESKKRIKASAEIKDGRITTLTLDNGIKLILREEHANPTVAFYLTVPGGSRYESSKTSGIGKFVASMLRKGSSRWTRSELSEMVESMAGGVGGMSGRNSAGVSGMFLAKDFDKGLEILSEITRNPTFSTEEIEKLRENKLAAIKREEDDLAGYNFKLMRKALYKTHPYGLPINGTLETVAGFTREDLVKFHKQIYVPERMVFTVVGDFKTDRAIRKIKEAFKNFEMSTATLTPPVPEERQTAMRTTGDKKDKSQTHIAIAFLGTTVGSKDRAATAVLDEILSGQGGRLFVNLRDKKSLAYSVSAFSVVGVDPGLFGAYIGTSPEKKDAAIKEILKELETISTELITDDELKRAKSAIIGGYEIGLQGASSKASDMAVNELLGLGYAHFKVYPKKIQAVTKRAVLRAARKYITLDAYTISIVGPGEKPLKEKSED